ncbi:S8 family peptidase [Bacillus sp. V5-8f]|uniref:S8 family peptidase n=1 Tax=Bacillus sp. V5-8f TaxID=2053044 RepID=UPI000C762E1B|nr:S8 family peptidase [Bacillus sp. V5-8f]PLT35420.1 peptidase S8 [Bacillus sp. V5-8f]
MARMRNYAITGFVVLLVAIGITMMMRGDGENNEQNRRVNPLSEANLRILNDRTNKDLLHINSLEDGISLKSHLRSHPEISIIKHNASDESHFHEHEVSVKFKHYPDKKELNEINKRIQGQIIKTYNSTIIFRSKRLYTDELLQYFNHQDYVDYAEPNYIYLQNEATIPNDSLYRRRYQWNFPAIQAEEGWEITRGRKDVIIAVVDTGVDLDHPDLRRRLTAGYNVVSNTHNPDDDNGHGTHVAGIIASETNNLRGVAGLTWYNKIMPIKAMAAKGYGNAFDIAQGIIWATDHGADIINLSLGNYQPSAVMHEAVQYAYKKGVVITVAAGNDNTDQPSYPAAYPEVLTVAAIDFQGNKAPFSNYGEHVDVAAPGVEIPSTYFHKQYAALSGTSMASPHVAAQAGLIKSQNPDLKNTEIMNVIRTTSYDLGPSGFDPFYGSGIIDIQESLRSVKKPENQQRAGFWEELKRLFQ